MVNTGPCSRLAGGWNRQRRNPGDSNKVTLCLGVLFKMTLKNGGFFCWDLQLGDKRFFCDLQLGDQKAGHGLNHLVASDYSDS